MPNRKTHKLAGALAGTWSALAHERVWLSPSDRYGFGTGGAIGGMIGGCAPDDFDPPCSPHHRQWAHALATAGFFAVKTWPGIAELVENILVQADREPEPIKRYLLFLLAGVVKGAGAGYLSHLALDGCTPCGLPLFGKLS